MTSPLSVDSIIWGWPNPNRFLLVPIGYGNWTPRGRPCPHYRGQLNAWSQLQCLWCVWAREYAWECRYPHCPTPTERRIPYRTSIPLPPAWVRECTYLHTPPEHTHRGQLLLQLRLRLLSLIQIGPWMSVPVSPALYPATPQCPHQTLSATHSPLWHPCERHPCSRISPYQLEPVGECTGIGVGLACICRPSYSRNSGVGSREWETHSWNAQPIYPVPWTPVSSVACYDSTYRPTPVTHPRRTPNWRVSPHCLRRVCATTRTSLSRYERGMSPSVGRLHWHCLPVLTTLSTPYPMSTDFHRKWLQPYDETHMRSIWMISPTTVENGL